MKIRYLPETLINQIAAGEVVERPAAAVKEMVENSIDAGATQIDVRIADGGKSLIAISDNGCGMSPEELTASLDRHATSKLPGEDLLNIAHLGFRGEALASPPCHVSRSHRVNRAAQKHGASRVRRDKNHRPSLLLILAEQTSKCAIYSTRRPRA
jgi:DNA mismatch repair protein MutL